MNRSLLWLVAGASVLGVYLLWRSQNPSDKTTGSTLATRGTNTPINNAPATSRSTQLQNSLIQLGAGLAANFLEGQLHQTEPSGANGGVSTAYVQSTAPATPYPNTTPATSMASTY